ncbi:MAG: hypothetical protein ABSC63_01475 [Candidatus Binataceae bacterium]
MYGFHIGIPHSPNGREKGRNSLWRDFSQREDLEKCAAMGFAIADGAIGSIAIPMDLRIWTVTDFGAPLSVTSGLGRSPGINQATCPSD